MLPFSPPRIDDKIIDEVVSALTSGWITTGPKTKEFENKIASYCDVNHVLAVSSWTMGAEMLLHWFGLKPGDEVIIPAYTYCATANIIIHCGAKPVMVDISGDFCIDVCNIEKAITVNTKAIIPVDLGGYPVDYDGIKKLVEREDIKVKFRADSAEQSKLGRILILSDAAHSFGASYKKQKVGSQADFTVFSFHAVKNLTTAEGGAICINMPSPFDNKAIYQDLNILSLHGQNKDALAKMQKGAWEYDVMSAGFKCNMTDILAAIGLVEIQRYEEETLQRRKAIFKQYDDAFRQYKWAILPEYISEQRESSYHLYLLRINTISLEQRNMIISKIFDKDIAVNVHYKPLPLLSFYKNLGYKLEDFTNSKNFWEQEITLPVYYSLNDKQIQDVVKAVVSSYNEVIV